MFDLLPYSLFLPLHRCFADELANLVAECCSCSFVNDRAKETVLLLPLHPIVHRLVSVRAKAGMKIFQRQHFLADEDFGFKVEDDDVAIAGPRKHRGLISNIDFDLDQVPIVLYENIVMLAAFFRLVGLQSGHLQNVSAAAGSIAEVEAKAVIER